jgi:hypothetical protein
VFTPQHARRIAGAPLAAYTLLPLKIVIGVHRRLGTVSHAVSMKPAQPVPSTRARRDTVVAIPGALVALAVSHGYGARRQGD